MVSYVNKILRLEKHNLSKAEKERKRQLKKQYNKLYKQMGTSFVYIIQESSNGYIKIGKASDPMTRIVHGLGAKSPYPLNVIHLIPTNSSLEVEKWFHVAFVKQRINGEWFQLTTKQIDKIKSGDYSLELLEIITK